MKVNGSVDAMVPSTQDMIALGDAVEEKFLDLCGSYLRIVGVGLVAPESLKADMKRWREMVLRHRRGDFRNSDAEMKSTRTFAQWLCDVNSKIRNQEPTVIQWRD